MNKVLVNFIQDRSGSMSSVWSETLSGYRAFIKELKSKSDVEYLFSLTTFDTQVETPIIAKPIAEVEENSLDAHGPRGSTALYDAVGTTIKNTEDKPHGADKIIVVIVTDGHENSSREWTKDSLHSAVEAKLNAGNWTFTYLGTQPETWDDAAALGVGTGSVRSYVGAQAPAAYAATAGAVHRVSASSKSGTRSLMDDYLPDSVGDAAGMGKYPTTRATTPSRPIKRPTKDTRRWR